MKRIAFVLLLIVLLLPSGITASSGSNFRRGNGYSYPATYFYDWEFCTLESSGANKDRLCRQVINARTWWQEGNGLRTSFSLQERTVYTGDLIVLVSDKNQDGNTTIGIDELILLFPESKNGNLTGKFVEVRYKYLADMNDVQYVIVLSQNIDGAVRDIFINRNQVSSFVEDITTINDTGRAIYATFD